MFLPITSCHLYVNSLSIFLSSIIHLWIYPSYIHFYMHCHQPTIIKSFIHQSFIHHHLPMDIPIVKILIIHLSNHLFSNIIHPSIIYSLFNIIHHPFPTIHPLLSITHTSIHPGVSAKMPYRILATGGSSLPVPFQDWLLLHKHVAM